MQRNIFEHSLASLQRRQDKRDKMHFSQIVAIKEERL